MATRDLCVCVLYLAAVPQATIKKSLFLVQRVAEIVASRAAAKSFFTRFCCCCSKNMMEF